MNRSILKTLVVCAATSVLGGCAVQSKYAWGTYETSLYGYYKNPAQIEEFSTALGKTISEAESRGQKVAPGIYAEYGHVLQQQGKLEEALRNYEKERVAWPESAVFMNTMIQSISEAQKKSATQGKNKT